MKPIVLIFIFAFWSNIAFGQQKYEIAGTVSDSVSGNGLPFVNVYFQGSTIGTQTDENGNFRITNVKSGKYKLVASMVSFKPNIKVLTIDKDINKLTIKLEEDQTALKELKVVGKRDKEWENNFKDFSLEFLGNNFKKKEVFVKNKEVVNFEKHFDTYTATAFEPLVIENYKLGYRVHFILQNFEKKEGRITINGIPRFENLTALNENQRLLWENNRIKAYRGSLKHLVKAILFKQLKEQNFRCQYLETDPDNMGFHEITALGNNSQLKFIDSNLVYKTNAENVFLVNFSHRVLVKYWNGNRLLERSILKQQMPIEVDEIGNIFDPMSIAISGGMADRRMASLLPFDFESNAFQTSQITDLEVLIPKAVEEPFKEPREKVEISMLKPFYLSGEQIDMDFSVTELQSSFVTNFSGILYVDIIDMAKGMAIDHLKLKLANGKTSLKYKLPQKLSTGNYQVRVYTKWMLNSSAVGFATKEILILNQNYRAEIPDKLEEYLDEVIVHTESKNHLILGLKSRLVIETKNNFGENWSTKFVILSPSNEEIFSSETDSLGLGLIEFTPTLVGKYKILAGSKTFNMPDVLSEGIVMATDYISSTDHLRVHIQNKRPDLDSIYLVILKNAQVFYFNKIPCRLPSFLFKIELPSQASTLNVFLLDNQYQILAEKTQVIDTVGTDFFTDVKRSFTFSKSQLFEFNRKYDYEKELSFAGNIFKKNGAELSKPADIKFIISDIKEDTATGQPHVFAINTKDKFRISGLDFYGDKKLSYLCDHCQVVFDSTFSLPPILPINKPINWKIVIGNSMEIGRRSLEIPSNSIQKGSILLEEVLVKATKLYDPLNKFSQSSPAFILNSTLVQSYLNTLEENPMKKIKNQFCKGADSIKLIINNVEEESIDGISPFNIEKLEIYKGTDAALFNCGCAINIVFKKEANTNHMDSIIINGYYRNQ
ncbi:carboxypeptidase-like regulatory domain-containing protein [Lacihabitans sp. CCS-44]|uniref:carboxypeptidase-like regulatory domain-containing protein n=1 Tax=Lacihabitans sp. CCS-44 TaxID=2487331 RepID=UPI0020CCC037|nr:carboxypeptidase-like regulatory domain-containing protein [Lacihabitans sp. CCS-44]MCP9756519.1 carboxypeptidase-like regulatory domain-containing protein [Lacihabitans sp. CCS-44]